MEYLNHLLFLFKLKMRTIKNSEHSSSNEELKDSPSTISICCI